MTLVKHIVLVILLLGCQDRGDYPGNTAEDSSASFFQDQEEASTFVLVDSSGSSISTRIHPPVGYQREVLDESSFAYFLSSFSVKADGAEVLLYNGKRKANQDIHAAVLDIDVGNRDLQQCADAVIRLRAEYLWSQKRYRAIAFNFTNGFKAEYWNWRMGNRIVVDGNDISWKPTSKESKSYRSFKAYMNMIFAYAGTHSLSRELEIQSIEKIMIGDVFISGGFPGHAVVVVDKAVHEETGEVMVLLAQSYMPAQNIHVLKNTSRPDISPWYSIRDFHEEVVTPEWTFKKDQLRKFK